MFLLFIFFYNDSFSRFFLLLFVVDDSKYYSSSIVLVLASLSLIINKKESPTPLCTASTTLLKYALLHKQYFYNRYFLRQHRKGLPATLSHIGWAREALQRKLYLYYTL